MTDKKQPESLEGFAIKLMDDLDELRAGKITVKDAKARTELAREVLRAFHLHLQGLRYMSDQSRLIGQSSGDPQ